MGTTVNSTLLHRNTPKEPKKKKTFPLEVPLYMGPITFIVGVFVFAPLLIILFYSFLKTGHYGEIV